MAVQHRILYRVIDEAGVTHVGRHYGEEDVRALRDKLDKQYRDAQLIYLEHEETIEHVDLTDDEQAILLGIERD
jgi:hypothetical protein